MWIHDIKFSCRLALFTLLTISLLSLIFPFTLLAQEPFSLANSQPPEAFENENYTWQLPVNGGIAPYSSNVTGTLPPGLTLNFASFAISGKPPRGVPADKYVYTIRIADSSNPPITVEATLVINVFYRSNISISTSLSEGETNIYVDGQSVTKLKGGDKTTRIFPSGTKHNISVDAAVQVPGKNGTKYMSNVEKILVDGLSPDALFEYGLGYDIQVTSNQPDIPPLTGSGFYKTGDMLNCTAPDIIEPKAGTQYKFAYWQLPTGEIYGNPNLNLKANQPGNYVATYEVYYLLTVNTEHCEAEGAGWQKAGTEARWTIKCVQSPSVSGFWGHLGVTLSPEEDTGTVLMDSAKEITITWKPDYSRLIIPTITGIIGAAILAVIGILHQRAKHVIGKIKSRR